MPTKTYKLTKDAPDSVLKAEDGFTPLEAGAEFTADYTPAQERALIAAGWILEAAEKKQKGGTK